MVHEILKSKEAYTVYFFIILIAIAWLYWERENVFNIPTTITNNVANAVDGIEFASPIKLVIDGDTPSDGIRVTDSADIPSQDPLQALVEKVCPPELQSAVLTHLSANIQHYRNMTSEDFIIMVRTGCIPAATTTNLIEASDSLIQITPNKPVLDAIRKRWTATSMSLEDNSWMEELFNGIQFPQMHLPSLQLDQRKP